MRTAFGTAPYWIGINDSAVEGTFVWSSGTPVTYTNWGNIYTTSDPNYYDYAVLDTNGLWYNYDYNFTSRPGIIEFDSTVDTDGDGLPNALDAWPTDPLNGWEVRGMGETAPLIPPMTRSISCRSVMTATPRPM